MDRENHVVDFFMGANTPNGFYSLYPELAAPRCGGRLFLIKGGPGTGKSNLIKKAAEIFSNYDRLTERIHCSSDPDSLDGVILHTAQAALLDATPPHVIEPTAPGGYETVINLCEYFDEEMLESTLSETLQLMNAISECHATCRRFLRCADILQKDNMRVAASGADFNKLLKASARICKKEFLKKGGKGKESLRFLSAVTNQGILSYTGTAFSLCSRIYLIRDEYGVVANELLQQLRQDALEKGHDVISCYCPLSPEKKLEHLFIPSLRLGFVTQSRFCQFEGLVPDKVINFTRFTDMEEIKKKRQYLRFNRKAADMLLEAAVAELKKAKSLHDLLEQYYTGAVNFAGVDRKTDEVLYKLAKRYPISGGIIL